MAWQIEFSPDAEKQLSKIDRQAAKRIIEFLRKRVEKAEDPRIHGAALKGVLRKFWRYRVGDYRIITKIEEDRLIIVVIRVGHRREVYRQ